MAAFPNCTEVPSALFGVENKALMLHLLQLPANTSSTGGSCHLAKLDTVTHLNTLKKIRVVSGTIAIADCLKLTTLGGGLSGLQYIGSTWTHEGSSVSTHLRIANTGLLGSLARMLPTIQDFALVAEIVNNEALCAVSTAFSWPATWIVRANAQPAQCGCTFAVALNYNPTALYDDGSCQATGCNNCHPGTHGPCAYSDADGAIICHAALDVRTVLDPSFFRCFAGHTACTQDLCKDVICDAPPECQTVIGDGTAGNGACEDGMCLYKFAKKDTVCNDGNPATGPDRCSAVGECLGKDSCVVAEMGGTPSARYGATVQTTAQLQRLEGCIVIKGNLHIDCQGAVDQDDISSLAPLLSLKRITGALVIQNCGTLTSLSTGLSSLEAVEGETQSSSIFLHNNTILSGSLPMELLALSTGRCATTQFPNLLTPPPLSWTLI